jgi:bacillithiol system protein YtxJ
MKWIELTEVEQLARMDEESQAYPVLILKHSTRCSISSVALNRIESNWKEEFSARLKPYYLDLLRHRDVSNAIASRYNVVHESPQVLVISNGKCIYTESHNGIRLQEIMERSS